MIKERIPLFVRYSNQRREFLNKKVLIYFLCIFLSLSSFLPVLAAESAAEKEPLVRVQYRNETIPVLLQTPILRYAGKLNDKTVRVDLIGAIHFADPGYYAELNRRFAAYEAVCVELVLPKGVTLSDLPQNSSSKPVPLEEPLDVVAIFQSWMGKTLKLTSQLDAINYHANNMVLADVDSETLQQWLAESDEINDFLFEIFLAAFSQDDAKWQNKPNAADCLAALLSRDPAVGLKRLFARMAAEQNSWEIPFEKSLLQKRNAVALARLKEQISAGKTNLALFYGVAHLPDLAERLEKEFGLRRIETIWLDAWVIK